MIGSDFKANISGCRELLSKDTSALASLVAMTGVLQDSFDAANPMFDEEGDILEFDALFEMLKVRSPDFDRDNLHRVFGLFMAATGSEFFSDPVHFERLVGAIVYGDPYLYEEDKKDPELVEMTWALFQVDRLLEEDASSLLEVPVLQWITQVAERNPDDEDLVTRVDPDFEGNLAVGEAYALLLNYRRIALAEDLKKCGAGPQLLKELGVFHSQS